MMEHELIEKETTRKWQNMTDEEKRQEIEMLQNSRYYKLFSIIMLHKRLNEII